jgi:4-amino-4-deoxy-L-arabinose transferase-like glycosyltransferase
VRVPAASAGEHGVRRRIASVAPPAVLGVFAAGVGIRVVFMVLYRPAFLGIPDSGSYLFAARYDLFSNVYDPAGYPLLIRLAHAVDPHLSFLILLQHALGVATAALLYLTVRRLTGSPGLGLVPAVIVLFDGYGLWVEHTPLSETLFVFLVAAVLYLALLGAERKASLALAIGVLAGLSVLVRPVGLVLAVVVVVWILAAGRARLRTRATSAAALILPVCAIVGGYVLIQRAEIGFSGLTQDAGRVIYARAAMFAECSQFTPPPGTRALCQSTPPSRRGSFNQYLTGYPDHATAPVTEADRSISPAWRVFGPPPNGNAKLEAFGLEAITHQPLAYLSHVAGDFHWFWADDHRAFIDAAATPSPGIEAILSGYDTRGPGVYDAGLGFLRWYGEHIEVSGVLMIALLLVPLLGLAPGDREPWRAALLLAGAGWLLPLGAVAIASVDPRFILPAYGPLAAAGAIGLRQAGWLRRALAARGSTLLRPGARRAERVL